MRNCSKHGNSISSFQSLPHSSVIPEPSRSVHHRTTPWEQMDGAGDSTATLEGVHNKNLRIPSCAGSGHQWSVLKAKSWSLLLPRNARGAVETAKANFLAAVWERIQVFQLWYQFLCIFESWALQSTIHR